MGDGTEEIFNSKIGSVRMYIFNEAGECLHEDWLTDEQVGNRSLVLPALAAGDYRVVFLGNPSSTSVGVVEVRSVLSSRFFGADTYWEGKETSGNDSLYWSSIDQIIEPFDPDKKIVSTTAHFAASHYDISVDVMGVPSAPKIVLTGVSPYTGLEDNVASDEETEYVLDVVHDGVSSAKASCNILRHLDHENVYLKVFSQGGEELASVNFADFLQENSQYVDCSKQEVLIPFKIEFKSAKVEVSLPDWYVIHVNPEF